MTKKKDRQTFKRGTMIADFQLDDLIGQGGYGDIYTVHRVNKQKEYAMKIELLESEKQGLADEIQIMTKLQGTPLFPEIIASGVTDSIRYLVMSLFGLSVSNTRRLLPSRTMSVGTATRLSIYMLDCLEDLHKRGFVHRDIKPGNFLFTDDGMHPLVLIDFGLSRDFINHETGEPLPERQKSGFRGTTKYASLNAHCYKDQSQRDDLVSWMYSVVELLNGKLLWTKCKDNATTRKIKQQTSDATLFEGMPPGFEQIWKYICHLQFAETPKYDLIREMLAAILSEAKVNYNDPFDWESLPPSKVNRNTPYVKLPLGSEMKQTFEKYLRKSNDVSNDLAEKSKCICCRII